MGNPGWSQQKPWSLLQLLTVGGRLVYWHPTTAKYTSAELASHPCMTLLSDKGQSISIKLKRRLVVMEKTCAWDAAMQVVPPTAMDVCEDFHYANDVGDCDEYVEYKQKRDQKKAACKRYREENAIDTPAKLTRGERRKLQQEQVCCIQFYPFFFNFTFSSSKKT